MPDDIDRKFQQAMNAANCLRANIKTLFDEHLARLPAEHYQGDYERLKNLPRMAQLTFELTLELVTRYTRDRRAEAEGKPWRAAPIEPEDEFPDIEWKE